MAIIRIFQSCRGRKHENGLDLWYKICDVIYKVNSALTKLVAFIKRRGGSATLREIAQSFWPLKNQRDKAKAMLDDLVSAGRARWGDVETTKRGGRPTKQIRLLSSKRLRNQAKLNYALGLTSAARLAAFKEAFKEGLI